MESFIGKSFVFKGQEVTVKGETDSGNVLVVLPNGDEQWTTHDRLMPIYALAA